MQPLSKDKGSDQARMGRGRADMSFDKVGSGSERGTPRALRKLLRFTRSTGLDALAGNRLAQFALTGIILLGGGMAFSHGQYDNQVSIAGVSSLAGFKPASLVLNGNTVVDGEMIETVLVTELGNSLFTFDAGQARHELLKIPWLKSASVSKVYPDTIRVDVVERQPFAFWKSDETVRVIARDGVVLGEAAPEHMRLPQVVGNGANLAAPEFIATISRFPGLSERSKAFVRIGGRRWNLALHNDLTVMLPEHDWREALVELDRLQMQQKILDRELVRIDMRLPDRLVLQLDEAVADARRERLENLLKRKWHRT